MVSVLYDDPLNTIDTARIEGWLVETDYPLDPTAINAALRSLEYAEIVHSTPNGLVITTGMMQTWLLAHARLGQGPVGTPESPAFSLDWRWVIAIVVVVVIVLLAISSAGQPGANTTPLPTVTLAGGG